MTCSPSSCTGFKPGDEFPKAVPNYNLLSNHTRCGFDSELAANRTQTATVLAGSEVGFRIATDIPYAFTTIGHEGPGQAYLHRSDNLETDLADGDFFKIATVGPLNDTFWKTKLPGTTDVNFTIPLTTPPGTYLLRMEHMFVRDLWNYTQLFVNCAHVNIVGPGGGGSIL